MGARDKKLEEFLQHAMDRMFRMVGFDGFDEEFTKAENWYTKRSWSEEEEREFRNWFIDGCRKELKLTKKSAEFEASYFLLMWGWSTSKK